MRGVAAAAAAELENTKRPIPWMRQLLPAVNVVLQFSHWIVGWWFMCTRECGKENDPGPGWGGVTWCTGMWLCFCVTLSVNFLYIWWWIGRILASFFFVLFLISSRQIAIDFLSFPLLPFYHLRHFLSIFLAKATTPLPLFSHKW